MARLFLLLFDHFQASLDGETITRFESNKVRALLAYLALEKTRIHSRDELAGLFWPDQSNRKARNNLRQALSNLRQAIADQSASPPFLLISQYSIQFNSASAHHIDVAKFNSLLEECAGHNHRHPDRCHSCARRRQQAVDLYAGDFLKNLYLRDSFLFEEWALLQRERLRPKALTALDGLVRYHQQHGHWEQASYYARRSLELEPWREEAHQQLMRSLAVSGQRSAALAQYHITRQILEEELGIQPTQETNILYNQIRDAGPDGLAPKGKPIVRLPQPASPLVGRKDELAQLIDLLDRSDCRLVTLTGPGGVGKTRLALQTALEQGNNFDNGVYFIDLVPVTSPNFLISTIAEALSVTFSTQIEPFEQLLNYLREKEILLVLDNFEHVLPGASLLSKLLKSTPDLYLLVTSRERLKLAGERVVELVGLPVGEGQESDQDAVAFFFQQARYIQKDWQIKSAEEADITQICQLIEGFPLAIELIVPWLRFLSPKEIHAELKQNIGLISTQQTSVDERGLSLQTVYDRSWQLLTGDEQRAFTWMSIFINGFNRNAAAEVADVDVHMLSKLVDKSLIRRGSDDRYHIHELLRHFALRKLADRGETEVARQAQLTYYLDFAEKVAAQIGKAQQHMSLRALESEQHNLHDVLQWTIMSQDQASAARLAEALSEFWITRAYYDEGIYWLEKVLYLSPTHAKNELMAGSQRSLGMLLMMRGDYDSALKWLEQARTNFTSLSDQLNLSRTLIEIGHVYLSRAEIEPARFHLEAGRDYAIAMNDRHTEALSLNYLGNIAIQQSDYDEGQKYHEESLALRRKIGDRQGMATSLNNLGVVAAYKGDYASGRVFFEKSLELNRELGIKSSLALLLNNIGDMDRFQGNYTNIKERYEEALALNQDSGNRPGLVWTLQNLGILSHDQGEYIAARAFFEEGLRLTRQIDNRLNEASLLADLGLVAVSLGELDKAGNYIEEAIEIHYEIGDRWLEGLCWFYLGFLLYIQENFSEGQSSSQKAIDLSREVNAHFVLGHALTQLGHNLLGQGETVRAQEAYKEAYTMRKAAGQTNLSMEPLAGLARVALAQGDMETAMYQVDEILNYLAENPIHGAMYPFLVHLTCIQVQQAADDPRADNILNHVYNQLKLQAAQLSSKALQETYMSLPAHKQISHLWGIAQST
jgi:predicted ATPase/DNA-binding SARP family transcriptional activator/Tfp pilus assembly protein PilF